MGVFGISVASAALPHLSRSAAHRNFAEFRETLSRSIAMILLLTIPAAVGLATLGESMIGIVYQHGRFLAFDTHQTARALSCYAVGLAGYSVIKLLAPAFYALGDSRTPMFVSMAAVLVNGLAAFTMVRIIGFGHAGLALSTSVVSTFSALTLLFLLQARIGGLELRKMLADLMKILAASAVMGVVCHEVVAASHAYLRAPGVARIADVLVGVPAGAAVFYAAAAALRAPELREACDAIFRKWRGQPDAV
jgi:putative peptidoglycan lipid II flippase